MRDIEGARFIREITHRHRKFCVVARPCEVDAHRASCTSITVVGKANFRRDIREVRHATVAHAHVAQEKLRRAIVGHENVGATIAVSIDKRKTQRLAVRRARHRIGDGDA